MRKEQKIGLIIGAMTILTTGVMAAPKLKTYTAQEKDYKIVIDGKTQKTTKTPVIIDGVTYLPVRDIAQNMLGYTVTLDSATNSILLTSPKEEKEEAPKSTHLYPYALGTTILGEIPMTKTRGAIPYTLKLSNVVRGKTAYDMLVKQYIETKDNITTEKARDAVDKLLPNSNYEFLIVSVDYRLGKGDTSEVILTTATKDFTAICGSAIQVDNLDKQFAEYKAVNATLGIDTTYANKKLYPQGMVQGWLVFAVYKDDTTPRVEYKDGQWINLY